MNRLNGAEDDEEAGEGRNLACLARWTSLLYPTCAVVWCLEFIYVCRCDTLFGVWNDTWCCGSGELEREKTLWKWFKSHFLCWSLSKHTSNTHTTHTHVDDTMAFTIYVPVSECGWWEEYRRGRHECKCCFTMINNQRRLDSTLLFTHIIAYPFFILINILTIFNSNLNNLVCIHFSLLHTHPKRHTHSLAHSLTHSLTLTFVRMHPTKCFCGEFRDVPQPQYVCVLPCACVWRE